VAIISFRLGEGQLYRHVSCTINFGRMYWSEMQYWNGMQAYRNEIIASVIISNQYHDDL
jgi:hypothetical protein